jgi:fructokinase
MRIGVDLGGTKTEGVVLNQADCELFRKRYPTPQSEGYSAILSTVVSLVRELEQSVDENCTVGIGTPGVISPADGSLRNSNTACLIGKPIVSDLTRELKRPVRIENDANCFALSEAIDGAGRGYETVFGVIMGTGVGGGIVNQGKLVRGRLNIAGEWGHNLLETDGPRCYCGRRGCVETFLSGPGLAADYVRRGGSSDATAKDTIHLADGGDEIAELSVQAFLQRFGRALATVINILDPHAIILGGGLSNVQRLFSEGREQVARHVFWHAYDTPILKNKNGDSAGVRGAAQLWPAAELP